MLSITIDWLSFTLKGEENQRKFYEENICADKEVPTRPLYGYRNGFTGPLGYFRYTNEARAEMGTHYVFPGSALKQMFDNGISPFELLDACLASNGKVTRLDLAKDCTGEGVQIAEIWKAIETGSYSGNTQKIRKWESPDGGYTIYIGAATSDKQIRIYNKGAESKTDMDWMRFEIQLRGDSAKTMARVISSKMDSAEGVFDAIAKRMFNCNASAYKTFFRVGVLPGIPKIEKQTDREAWVRMQVTSAVLEHLSKEPDSKAVYALYTLLDNHYRSS